MKIDLQILKHLWKNSIYINCNDADRYDYVNIVHINEQPPESNNHLFFCTYELHPEKEGWFIKKFDRRLHLPKITYDKPHWTFVIEKDTSSALNPSTKIIKVDKINESIRILFDYV